MNSQQSPPTVTTEKSILMAFSWSLSPSPGGTLPPGKCHDVNINRRTEGLIFFRNGLSPKAWLIPMLVSHE